MNDAYNEYALVLQNIVNFFIFHTFLKCQLVDTSFTIRCLYTSFKTCLTLKIPYIRNTIAHICITHTYLSLSYSEYIVTCYVAFVYLSCLNITQFSLLVYNVCFLDCCYLYDFTYHSSIEVSCVIYIMSIGASERGLHHNNFLKPFKNIIQKFRTKSNNNTSIKL